MRNFDFGDQTQFTGTEISVSQLRKKRGRNTQFIVIKTFIKLSQPFPGVCISGWHPQPGKSLPPDTGGTPEAFSIKEKSLLTESRRVRYKLFLNMAHDLNVGRASGNGPCLPVKPSLLSSAWFKETSSKHFRGNCKMKMKRSSAFREGQTFPATISSQALTKFLECCPAKIKK